MWLRSAYLTGTVLFGFASNVPARGRLCSFADQYRNSHWLTLGFPISDHNFSEMKFLLFAVFSPSENNLN